MNQIHVFADERNARKVKKFLEAYGFERHVAINDLTEISAVISPIRILVENGAIRVLPDWFNQSLPVFFPSNLKFDQENLVSLVMYYSGLIEDALNLSSGKEVNVYYQLFAGAVDWESFVSKPKDHVYWHNHAVLSFYQGMQNGIDPRSCFERALQVADNAEAKLFSVLHYAVFLQDTGAHAACYKLLQTYLQDEGASEASRMALKLEMIRCESGMTENWTKNQLIAHKARVWEVYTFYRDQHATMLEAQLCREMAEVARFEENYSESLSYISKCIHIYLAEQLPEMEAEAYLFKGTLLHQWAKTGSPQFYQQAVKCYQKALHVFKKEETPHLFAQVHHQLGVLYAEMPDDQKKRAIWAAVSATSFKEALSYFDKANSPLEYATVCHNYATALMQYPDAVRSDNVVKAINLFEEALLIRTEDMPEERCVTLLNYLEACWEAENVNETMERVRVKDMQNKALEAFSLAPNEELKSRATEHLNSINKVLEEVTI